MDAQYVVIINVIARFIFIILIQKIKNFKLIGPLYEKNQLLYWWMKLTNAYYYVQIVIWKLNKGDR